MKIWIIDHYSSEPKYGGISRQFDFAQEFSSRGHDVTVISSGFSHFSHSYISNEKIFISEINSNARYVYIKTSSYTNNGDIKRVLNCLDFAILVNKNRKQIEKHFGIPDAVVGCSIHPFTWLTAEIIAKKYKVPFIVEVRDLWPQTWVDDYGESPYGVKAIVFGVIEKNAYKNCDKIIYSMSQGDKYICEELGYPRDKVMWIDQPMDCTRFDKNAEKYDELPEEIKTFIGDDFLCVFTGYYVEYEGVYEMLEASNILQTKHVPIKFLFVGSGQDEGGMRKYASENNLINTYIGGRISKEQIPSLLRRADICLAHLAIRNNPQSYKYDASKNKINEYMYADACILYGTHLKNHFVETSGAGHLLEPYNAVAFAEAIERVYNMPIEERKRFGENGMKYIREHNTVGKLIDKYIELLKLAGVDK
jgi:glycosyltransferase involved in cell wall biosynthesis